MLQFFDDEADFAAHIIAAKNQLWPLLELLDGGGEKYKTALFIIMTRHAIEANNLQRATAHIIIDSLFDEIGDPPPPVGN